MKILLFVLIINSVFHSFDMMNEELFKPSVKVLTIDTFNQEINKNPFTFVLFYAPWCSHCKRIFPDWESLASMWKLSNGNIVFSKVDCTSQTELCSDNDILSYPTLIFYKNSIDNFDRYESQKRDADSLNRYIKLALYDTTDRRSMTFEEYEADIVALHDLNEANFDKFISEDYHFVKFFAPWCSHCVNLAPTWKKLAENYVNFDNIKISHVDCTKNVNLCKRQKIESYPSLILFHNGKLIGKYQGSRTIEDLTNYLSEMTIESSPKITTNTEIVKEYVKVIDLNKDNFKEILKKDGLVFIKFYVKWCPHCKNLEPTWNELAQKFTDTDKIYISRIDCTENSDTCLDYQITGYPSLYLFKNGMKIGNFQGSRNLKDLYDFIVNHNNGNKRLDEL